MVFVKPHVLRHETKKANKLSTNAFRLVLPGWINKQNNKIIVFQFEF